ncbi:MAG TPA: hypothetical protein ENF88_00310 [Candidatus Acetothermia bacterium]|nr:hypothetical protein [Candidatus Acetothermia bacterium]HEX32117.1 hypothetical protein [Candidatus Acetothermia bacterium]
MDKEELRQLVFKVLRRDPQTHLNAVEYQVRGLAEDYDRHDALKIQEIIWELLVQGVLAPGKNSLNLNLPFFHVTDYGYDCLESGEVILHDYDRYLHDLEASIDEPLDPTIRTYVHAAQKAFLCGNYLATMSLLADAGSRCVDMVNHLIGKAQDQHSVMGKHPTHAEIGSIHSYLPTLGLSDELREEIALHLRGLENLIAHTRDEDGHPRAVSIGHWTAQSALLGFPQYLRALYRLIAEIRDRSRA